MKELKNVAGFLFIFWLLSLFFGNHKQGSQGVIPEPIGVAFNILGFFYKSPIIRAAEFLGIVDSVNQALADTASYDEKSNTVSFHTVNPDVTGVVDNSSTADNIVFKTPEGNMDFSPATFMTQHHLVEGDKASLQRVDEQMLQDYSECTDIVLASGEANQITMLNMRLHCLAEKGYNQTDQTYMNVKLKLTGA